MKITLRYLKLESAPSGCIAWYKTLKTTDLKTILKASIASHDPKIIEYGNWLILSVFTNTQKVQYAIFAARQVLGIFERQFPEDLRPRKAIESAEAYLNNPSRTRTDITRLMRAGNAAWRAFRNADIGYEAAWAAESACAAAWASAGLAAEPDRDAPVAACAAWAADRACAWAADRAGACAWFAWAEAACAAEADMKVKIIKYGMSLLKPQKSLEGATLGFPSK